MDVTRDRAEGCFLGQLIGDALGSLVEFQTPDQIRRRYPDGVRDLEDGGTWDTIAGQPTDDSEMALALARTLVSNGTYDQASAREAYVRWLESRPFDVGNTVASGLRGVPNFESQANGALMRVSPLGIFCAQGDPERAARWAREDAWITHPNEVPQDANVLFVLTIAYAIAGDVSPRAAFDFSTRQANEHQLAPSVRESLRQAESSRPASYVNSQGWVLIAVQNAWYQLHNASSFEDALVDTVMQGGDTDTNAAICGALLGAVYGRSGIPERWVEPILKCRPAPEIDGIRRPRPEEYWPVDVLDLSRDLVRSGRV